MGLNTKEKDTLQHLLYQCQEKFGELSQDKLVYSSSCESCTGSCKGHGISVWTACDVR